MDTPKSAILQALLPGLSHQASKRKRRAYLEMALQTISDRTIDKTLRTDDPVNERFSLMQMLVMKREGCSPQSADAMVRQVAQMHGDWEIAEANSLIWPD